MKTVLEGNEAIGRSALFSNTTGSKNTAIGKDANVGFGNLTNATAIGAAAVVSQSNSLVLGNGANVGIGTSSPTAKLHVVGETQIDDRSGIRFIYGNVTFNIRGDTAGQEAALLNVEKSDTTKVSQIQADGNIQAPELPVCGIANCIGLVIDSDGFLQKETSSARYKKNIQPFDDNFDLMLQAELKSWTGLDGKGFGLGYIAEELDELGLTNMVTYDDQGRPESIVFRAITFYMLEIVKRHNASIADHESRLAEKDTEIGSLQSQVTELEDRLSAVEQAVGVSEAPAGSSLFGGLTMGLIFGGLLLVTPGLVVGYRRFNR